MPRRIAFFTYGLTGGGVPRSMVALANALAARGDRVDLVLIDAADRRGIAPAPEIRVVSLAGWRTRLPGVRGKRRRQFAAARPALARYLAAERPDVLIPADTHANLAALEARSARVSVPVPVIVTVHTHTSTVTANRPRLLRRIRRGYPAAAAVVGVSRAVVDDLVALGIPRGKTATIHNPVIPEDFDAIAARPVAHPWFQPGAPPVVLGAGRVEPQKDFATLIRAFAHAREARPELRLVILGDAKRPADRDDLLALAASLGVAEAVDLPGAVPEAVPYMARAALFVLSSRYEGWGNVLVEALACGTPVVSTDCPGGPAEVLEDGRHGPLVPVGDHAALGRAMLDTLARPPERAALAARGRAFSVGRALRDYVELIERVAPAPERR